MTRKDLQTVFNIYGENKDIQLFWTEKQKRTGNGYCGNIALKNGKAVFNGKAYADLETLGNALDEWAKTLEYPVDTYCPLYRESWRTESRILWYLTEKMGFKRSYRDWEMVYVRPIGPSFNLEFCVQQGHDAEEEKVVIISKYGAYTFRNAVDNAEDAISTIHSIINGSVLEMAKDMVDVISVCDAKTAKDIKAYVPANNIFGLKEVSFKEMMIAALEAQLKALKEE